VKQCPESTIIALKPYIRVGLFHIFPEIDEKQYWTFGRDKDGVRSKSTLDPDDYNMLIDNNKLYTRLRRIWPPHLHAEHPQCSIGGVAGEIITLAIPPEKIVRAVEYVRLKFRDRAQRARLINETALFCEAVLRVFEMNENRRATRPEIEQANKAVSRALRDLDDATKRRWR
jgi:hypothetical protein